MKIDTKTGTFWNADTFDAMREIPDDSVDMLLVDLPYGTTAIAACRSGRRWLCIERDPVYFGKAIQRVFTEEEKHDQ